MLTLPAPLGVAAVLVLLVLALGAVRLVQRRTGLAPEPSRKVMHAGMGAVTLTFPWVFDGLAPIAALAVLGTGLMVALRRVAPLRERLGGVIHGVDRRSWGDLCFAPAVAAVWWLAEGDVLLYAVPVAHLAFADAAAALVGLRWGRLRVRTLDGVKTVEGALAGLAVAFVAGALLLRLGGLAPGHALAVAAVLAAVTALVEAATWRGMDNATVPLAAALLLPLLVPLAPAVLAGHVVLLAALLGPAAAWQRLTGAVGAAAPGLAVVGYTAWLVGGAPALALAAVAALVSVPVGRIRPSATALV